MSTKCQYHAAASNPKWWEEENCPNIMRCSLTIKKVVPIITWSPWNPVEIKKVDPKILSLKLNGASIYSNPWSKEKYRPNKIVMYSEIFLFLKFLLIIDKWLQVIEIPELKRIMVFKRGVWYGLNAVIPIGGHIIPIFKSGASLAWK